jgi:hypothetical protein
MFHVCWPGRCVLQVCFAMFMPNLLRNFLYVQHNSGCWWLDLLLRFVASELHCCANFSRKFFWSSEHPGSSGRTCIMASQS